MTTDKTIVYQADAYNITPSDLAREFARRYFGEVREVEGELDGEGRFSLVDGNAVYKVEFLPGQHLVSRDLFVIIREG